MYYQKRMALSAILLFVPAFGLLAQEPVSTGVAAGGNGAGAATAAAITASKEDPAAVERGGKAYVSNCGGCHGATGRGGPGAPDLIRSLLVLDDEKGILIAPVIRNGRPDQGMPKLNLSESQISDIVAWLHVQTYAAGHRNTYAFLNVVTGDAKKGEGYFNGAGKCSTCHSAAGDLKGIGARYDAFSLQSRWLQPRGGRGGGGGGGGGRGGRGGGGPQTVAAKSAESVKVTLSSGEAFSGTLDHIDDFNVSLRAADGSYHSFNREGAVPKVEVVDPLKMHNDLLGKYTDADIHNVTAYLVTLK